jgi:hypothetical protein
MPASSAIVHFRIQGGLGHAFLVPDPLANAVGGTLLGTDKPEFVL